MLVVLVTVCAITATVVVIHLNSNGSDADVAQPRDRVSRRADSEEPSGPSISNLSRTRDEIDYRFWQRVMTRQEGTGYWQFFPIIPWDVLPGETVVLSVSSTGFLGWEVDTDFAHVDLFDEIIDEENAYVSFIMPEDYISIAAIYTEVPHINFEKQEEMLMSMRDMYEQGSAILPLSDSIVTPLPIVPTVLPNATVGQEYTVTITNPANTPTGMRIRWELTVPALPATNVLPTGLEWLTGGAESGIVIDGVPEVATIGGPASFYFDLYDMDDPDPTTNFRGRFRFRLNIYPPGQGTTITTYSVPDAMVGISYHAPIELAFLRPGETWAVQSIQGGVAPNGLPPGFVIVKDLLDTTGSKFAIFSSTPTGTPPTILPPTVASPEPTPDFVIVLEQTNTTQGAEYYIIESPPLNIRVWDPPVITPSDPLARTVLLPGIADGPDVVTPPIYTATLNATDGGSGVLSLIDKFGNGVNWTWYEANNTKPPTGLKLTDQPPSTSSTTTDISGNPTEAGVFNFTILYEADPTVLIGWLEYDYSIEIYEPPQFSTGVNLKDAMDWRPVPVDGFGAEPPDKPYDALISAGGFPQTADSAPAITWDWRTGVLPPSAVSPDNFTFNRVGEVGSNTYLLKGLPQLPGALGATPSQNYTFDVFVRAEVPTNANIHNIEIKRTFNLWIWERRYLYIEYMNTSAFVRRKAEPGEPLDTNWNAEGWDWNITEANLYRGRRAVMPNTEGEIRVPLSASGFTRWEVLPANDTRPNSNRNVRIGDNWDNTSSSTNSFVTILMPVLSDNGVDRRGGDVYIRGIDAPNPLNAPDPQNPTGPWIPLWRAPFLPGTVNDPNSSGFITYLAALGNGDRTVTWDIVEGELPPGMSYTGAQNTMLITSWPDGPTEAGPFPFKAGINLPGSMRVTSPTFTMIVNLIPDVDIGDVNGDGALNLADLVMLTQFVNGDIFTMPNMAAGFIVTSPTPTAQNPNPRPMGADLNVLAKYFSRPEASLPESNPSPSPSPNP